MRWPLLKQHRRKAVLYSSLWGDAGIGLHLGTYAILQNDRAQRYINDWMLQFGDSYSEVVQKLLFFGNNCS